MNRTLLKFTIVLLSLFFVFGIYNTKNSLDLPLRKISLIVVNDYESIIKGLGNRKSLSPSEAMLFVFEKTDKYGIWMKDMKFPIDIIWLDSNKKIVHIEKSISPDTYPRIFYPSIPSSYILEANQGFVIENNLQVGNYLNFNLK